MLCKIRRLKAVSKDVTVWDFGVLLKVSFNSFLGILPVFISCGIKKKYIY